MSKTLNSFFNEYQLLPEIFPYAIPEATLACLSKKVSSNRNVVSTYMMQRLITFN